MSTASPDLPDSADAKLHLLFEGYVGNGVASTVVLILDGDSRIVVDPGMVPGQRAILDPLAELGVDPGEVTDVVLSHHHPDHTLNAGLFPMARVHDHWAIYKDDRWDSRSADRAPVSPSVRADRHAGPFAAGHHHAGRHRRRDRRLHAPVVVGGGTGRRPLRARPRPAPRRARAGAGGRLADRPRPRRRVHPVGVDTAVRRLV
jgi:glyoxylase-like metal-dependent hydrolase (beta-lactamase superfamily II)